MGLTLRGPNLFLYPSATVLVDREEPDGFGPVGRARLMATTKPGSKLPLAFDFGGGLRIGSSNSLGSIRLLLGLGGWTHCLDELDTLCGGMGPMTAVELVVADKLNESLHWVVAADLTRIWLTNPQPDGTDGLTMTSLGLGFSF
jgi:hypothetical protein